MASHSFCAQGPGSPSFFRHATYSLYRALSMRGAGTGGGGAEGRVGEGEEGRKSERKE